MSAARRRMLTAPLAAALLLASRAAAEPPARLVLALDGAAYHHVRALQAGTGGRRCFADYQPASRLISTYPSLSEVAWADIFGLGVQDGYQPLHYNRERNRMTGARGLSAMGEIQELHRHIDWHLAGEWTNLAGYLFPRRVFRHELDRTREAFLKADGRPEFYALLQTLDYAVHMGRDAGEYLCAVDAWLSDLRREHARRTGRELEVIILSDHGTDDAVPRRVPVPEHLRRSGFRVVDRLRRRGDVVMPVDGMLGTLHAYALAEDVVSLGAALAELPGVDLVTIADPYRADEIRVLKRGEEAVIRRRGASYAYVPIRGDPLLCAGVAAELKRSRAADRDGYAAGEAWLAATASHRYPAALERIVRAHGALVRNPAPVIVSLEPGRVSVNRPTWILSRLVTLGGTHGALDDRSSCGVALSTSRRTQDTTTDRIGRQFGGFTGLRR